MLFCRETACLGWSLSPSDQFCAWCGARLVEITVSFESKVGEEWVPLTPPVLNRERPPALRLRITHEGEAGSFPMQPSQLICSAPWLGFDTSNMVNARLHPGQTVHLPVNRLKIPGKEETFHEAKIQLSAAPSGEASHSMIGSVTLSFVPPPRFQMELETNEVLLSSEGAPSVDGTLLLERGRVWLESPPRLVGDWASLEMLDEDPERPLRFPLELDGREQPRLRFRLHFAADQIADIRLTGSENPTALRRNNKLVLTCRDRGMRVAPSPAGSGPGSPPTGAVLTQEALKVELPLQLNFILAPEAYLEPFTSGTRGDWNVIVGGNDKDVLKLRLRNGPSGSGGRQDLVVRQVGLRQRTPSGDLEKCFTLEIPRPTPWTLAAGEAVDFGLRFHANRAVVGDKPISSTVEVVLVSNDPISRSFFLDFKASRPRPFPGWLAIDLGTSNTCAALVDENRKVTLVPLAAPEGEEASVAGDEEICQLASAVCYLRLRREHELEIGQRAVERSHEPAATRAVVVAAKRRIGNPAQPYSITPLDEPGETLPRTAEAVLQDIYRHVIDRASNLLLEQGRQEIVITRIAITHPSRFSVMQVGHLKRSASLALESHLRSYFPEASVTAEPMTLHEPIGAALHFLNEWRQQASLFDKFHDKLDSSTLPPTAQDRLNYHLFVYDFGGGTLDMTLIKVECTRQPLRNPLGAEHGFSYTVSPLVLGAMGERWFGGQDVTRELVELIRQRLDEVQDSARLLWPDNLPPEHDATLQMAARRNESLLTSWAEQLKIALVTDAKAAPEGNAVEEVLLSFPSLHFYEGGKERLWPASSLRRSLRLPSLEELQDRIRPRLKESLHRARQLISRHGLEGPDLVLQVGQSCRLPAVEESLREAFPGALHLRSSAPKSCVVQGASSTVFPGVSGGVQLSRNVDRPGIRLKLAKDQSLSATTSRLGIKVLDAGKAWFQEILGEGIPIPREGLHSCLEGVVLEAGPNAITLLENCGNRDELIINQTPNREIQAVRECSFDIPGEAGSLYEDCTLRMTIQQDLSLLVEVKLPGQEREWLEIARISSQEFGGFY